MTNGWMKALACAAALAAVGLAAAPVAGRAQEPEPAQAPAGSPDAAAPEASADAAPCGAAGACAEGLSSRCLSLLRRGVPGETVAGCAEEIAAWRACEARCGAGAAAKPPGLGDRGLYTITCALGTLRDPSDQYTPNWRRMFALESREVDVSFFKDGVAFLSGAPDCCTRWLSWDRQTARYELTGLCASDPEALGVRLERASGDGELRCRLATRGVAMTAALERCQGVPFKAPPGF